MDLSICPACKQSVLDDDAVVCPFCGAAMDGSSGPKKPVAKPAAKPQSTASEKAAAKPAKPASPPPAASTAVEEDPFAVKPRKAPKAIPLQRKPTAKINHRVVCPMCDTNGFATPAVAGKEVRCPNPKCLMPVFTAPELEKVAPPPPPKSAHLPMILGMVAVGLLVAGGVGYYVFVLNPVEPKPPEFKPAVVDTVPQTLDPSETKEEVSTKPPEPPQIPLAELETRIFENGIEAARQRNDNRSKEFCRVLNAEAYAVRGRIEEALGQLQAFDNMGSGLDFMKITPLSRIAWHHLNNGDRAAAEKVADQALAFTTKLPRTGADAVQQTVVLGTLLIALERYQAARDLIESRETIQDVAQSAARVSMVIEDGSYDLARSYHWLPRVELASPLAFAATYGAAVRGYEKQALQWIGTLQSTERKDVCIAAYAAGTAMRAESVDVQNLLPLPELTDTQRQRAAAVALQVVQLKKEDAAVAALQQQIGQALSQWSPPAPKTMPDMRGIYDGVYQPASPELSTAVQAQLLLAKSLAESGRKEEAWQQIAQALLWLQANAPARSAIQPVMENLERNRGQIQEQLASLYSITRDDAKPAAFNQYRKNARTIEEQAQQRYELEKRVLNLALQFGLAGPLYQAYQQETPDSNFRKIVEADLMTEVIFLLNATGNSEASRQLAEKWPEYASGKSIYSTELQLQRLIDAGHVLEAHDFYRANASLLKQPLQSVRYTSQLAETKSADVVVEWVNAIPDVIEQELAYRLAAAKLTQRGLIRECWRAAGARNLSATEKSSLNLGLMEGLSTLPQETEPPATPAATKP